MLFKWPVEKVIHRFGYRFVSDIKGELDIDVDSLKKRVTEIDKEGQEIVSKETLSKEEKEELLSALKGYGFAQVIEKK